MAYSGTTTWAASGVQIATRAAAKLLVIDTSNGETLDSNTLSDFMFQLNAIAKETMACPGVIPWTTQMNTLFTQNGQDVYFLGSTAGSQTQDNWTNAYISATLVNAAPAATTSFVLSGVTGSSYTGTVPTEPVAGDFIGIKLSTGVTFWTTVSSWTSGTSTVVTTTGLPGPADAGAYVYDYTKTADRPQKILQLARSNTSGIDIRLDPMSIEVYNQLPNKLQAGFINQWHFTNTIPNAQLLVWQPNDGTNGWDRLSCWCDTIIQDFDAAGKDTPYYPVEWANYLVWQLALEMGDEYELSDTKMTRIEQIATSKFNNLLNYSGSLSKSPLQFGMSQNAWSIQDD